MRCFAMIMGLVQKLLVIGACWYGLLCVAAGGDGKQCDGDIGVMVSSFALCLILGGAAYVATELRNWAWSEIKRVRLVKQREFLKLNQIKEKDYA